MKMMIAFRRVSTPTTPIVNSTAEKKSASASIGHRPSLAQHHRPDDRGQQEYARDLEREEVFVEQGARDRRDDASELHLARHVVWRDRRLHVGPCQHDDLREHGDSYGARSELPGAAAC